jgi:CubicO group peptidase (beta-lactamase class C family)
MSLSYDQTNTVQHIGPDNSVQTPTEFERDLRSRSHLRDEKHAALSVLLDRELLVTYALAAREVRTNFNTAFNLISVTKTIFISSPHCSNQGNQI